MADIEYTPPASVTVKLRTKTLVVIERDSASCIASSIRIAVVTLSGAKPKYISNPILETPQITPTLSLGEMRAYCNLKTNISIVFFPQLGATY